MPYAIITTAGPALSHDQRNHLHAETIRLLADGLGKNPAVTSVRIEETPTPLWSVGGETGPAAHLDVKITQGTNTAEQKRRFIADAHGLLAETLPGLADATYVVVHELPADNWGYAGKTQADRKREIDGG